MASLASALQHLLKAKRISAASQSYAKDNPGESQKVFAYLNGGSRPTGVASEMGMGLVEVEDVRRAQLPPPAGNYIDTIAELTAVFLPTYTTSDAISPGVTNPVGLGGGLYVINDAAGTGYRFVSTTSMIAPWQSDKKVCLGFIDLRTAVGAFEQWNFKYRFPAAINSAFPHSWQGGTIFEFGHHATNSGIFIGIDGRQLPGDEGHMIGVPVPPFGVGDFQFYKICETAQIVKDKDYVVDARIKYAPDNTGYVRIKVDGVTIIDQNRPTRPSTSEIPKFQPGWYSDIGSNTNGVEIRNLQYNYNV
jgi:hypothetical protein